MSTIVWTTLITAAATVTGSLGGIWIKARYDNQAQARQAEQSRAAARIDQQRQAYGELVKTARLALRNFRQLNLAYAAKTPDIPAVQEAFSQTASLAAEMNQAVAVAELVGSPEGRKHARAIYDKARTCADLFQSHELYSAAVADSPLGKAFAPIFPGGMEKWVSFNAAEAASVCDELAAAIDEFIEAANTELAQ